MAKNLTLCHFAQESYKNNKETLKFQLFCKSKIVYLISKTQQLINFIPPCLVVFNMNNYQKLLTSRGRLVEEQYILQSM